MEPRSAERGNRRADGSRPYCRNSFNGATLSRTWKPENLSPYWTKEKLLQWSHAQPNVETISNSHADEAGRPASMEPRSAERGNRRVDMDARGQERRFNGATLSRTWKRQMNRNSAATLAPASMEPRSAERGNSARKERRVRVDKGFNGATLSRTWKPQTATEL